LDYSGWGGVLERSFGPCQRGTGLGRTDLERNGFWERRRHAEPSGSRVFSTPATVRSLTCIRLIYHSVWLRATIQPRPNQDAFDLSPVPGYRGLPQNPGRNKPRKGKRRKEGKKPTDDFEAVYQSFDDPRVVEKILRHLAGRLSAKPASGTAHRHRNPRPQA
jgi:hypothetical protein